MSPVYLFSGYIVNINVSTRAHRDLQDKKICLIIVISSEDCIGGELCLVELGLVLRLQTAMQSYSLLLLLHILILIILVEEYLWYFRLTNI